MAGKQTFKFSRTNKAYAEGRHTRFIGGSASDNPWPVTHEEETVAWAFGYAAPDGEIDDTCYSGFIGLPAATGLNMPAPGVLPLTHWPEGALTHLLDTLHISYSHNATRDQLIALVPSTHHAQIAEDVPSDTWTITRIKEWLDNRQVSYTGITGKDNLLVVVHDVIAFEATSL
jgi:hypothetical protein